MDHYKETSETWNKLATRYEERFMDLDLYNDTYDHICNSIKKPNGRILEIGCGPGNITKYLLSKRPDFDIFGIDIAPNMIELAKKNNPSARFAVMDCRKFIADCYSLLNEGGLIYISFVEGDPNKSGFQVSKSGDRSYFYYYQLDELKKNLIESDFGVLTVFKVEYTNSANQIDFHTIISANKNTLV